jgi:hypothetical protein
MIFFLFTMLSLRIGTGTYCKAALTAGISLWELAHIKKVLTAGISLYLCFGTDT